MASFESTITIGASGEAVWRALSTVEDWPKWLPTVRSVQPLDGPELGLGRRFRVVQPKLAPSTWIVTVLDPPSRFLWQSQSPGVLVHADHVVEARSPHESVVSLRITFSGALSGMVCWFFGKLTARYLAIEAAALEQRVKAVNASDG